MSRVLQGQTTGRFEVEDFAKQIPDHVRQWLRSKQALMVVSRSERPARFKITRPGVVIVHRGVPERVGPFRCLPCLRASAEENWRKGQRCQGRSFNERKRFELGVVHG